jgi:hypothetical protein
MVLRVGARRGFGFFWHVLHDYRGMTLLVLHTAL